MESQVKKEMCYEKQHMEAKNWYSYVNKNENIIIFLA